MGQIDEVVLVIDDKYESELNESSLIYNLLNQADKRQVNKNSILYYWEYTKWYGEYVDELMSFISTISDKEFYFIRMGNDIEDIEIRGNWNNNPFQCGVERNIVWNSDNSTLLKIHNTSPDATNCSRCKGKLCDPGLGSTYKHCPICEP